MNILVTGSNGFIGSALCNELLDKNFKVTSITRNTIVKGKPIGDINGQIDWSEHLQGIDCIVHTANIAHEALDKQIINSANYRIVNIDGTINLAEQAIKSGVKKFIYLSSISVMLSSKKQHSNIINENTIIDQRDLSIYANSKYIAEKKLNKLTLNSDMNLIIVRPPMVYGGKLIGNFGALVNILKKRIPIPFSLLESTRSFIYIGNLVDFLIKIINHSENINEALLVSDDADCKVKDFIKKIAHGLNMQPILFPLPIIIVRFLLNNFLKGKGNQLLDSLEMDISKTKKILNWVPPFSMDQGIMNSCKILRNEKRN